MAQLVIAAAGAAIGGAIGGPAGAQIGWTIGSIIGGQFGPTQKSKGPRLDDLKVTSGEYGQGIPWIAGHPRVSGQVWWSSERREIATTTEVGKGGGGAEYTEYSYEVDLLIGLTEREIAGVSRIWMNGKMIWSALDTVDDDSYINSVDTDLWDRITVYTGASDQLPDATYEAVVGVGNAPAYRGRGSVFIEGLQLGNSGQLPNLTFEVARTASNENNVLLLKDISQFDATITQVGGSVDAQRIITKFEQSAEIGNGGNYYRADGSQGQFDGNTIICAEAWVYATDYSAISRGLLNNLISSGLAEGWALSILGGKLFGTVYLGNAQVARQATNAFPLNQWVFVQLNVSASTLTIYEDGVLVGTIANTLGGIGSSGGDLYIGQQIRDSFAVLGGFIDEVRISRVSRSTAVPTERFPEPDADVLFQWRCNARDTLTPADETVRQVVEDLCERADMPAGAYDASALDSITREVRALSVANVTGARSVIEQLAAAYFFECYLSDKLYFVPRGGAVALAVDNADLGAGEGGAAAESLPVTVASDVEIPAQISLSYANVDGDYNTATEHSDRLLTGVVSTSAVQLALGMTSSEAKGVVDAMLQDAYAGRITGSAALGQAYSRLVPTDVVTLTDSDGTAYRARLVRRNDDGLVIGFDWVLDDASALVSAGVTSDDYTPTITVAQPGLTDLLMLDIPLLRDADDSPGLYGVAKPATGTLWPGAKVYSSLDAVDYIEAATASSRGIFGVTTVALTSYSGGYVFDHAGSVTVDVGAGTLASASRDAVLDSEANAMLVGNEVVQFMTATLVTPGVYKLTGLLRGRRGTEWAMTGHAIGERAVLLSAAKMFGAAYEAARIGLPVNYKGVTLGKTVAGATAIPITDTGVRLKPWAPADLRQDLTASQLTLTWSRRTRLSTRFLSSSAFPLGESTEAYDVDLINGASQVVLSERVTAPTWQFSGAVEVARDAVGYVLGYDYAGSAFGVTLEGASYSWKFLVQHVAGVSTSQLYLGNQVNDAIGVGSQFYASAVDVNSSAVAAVVSASTLYRVDLSAPTVTAAQRSAATLNDVFSLAHDGINLWAVESDSGNLLRLNDSTLATVNTYAVGGKPRGLQYGGGFLYWFDQATGEAVKWEIATTSETWRELTGGGAQGGVLRLAGSLLFNAGGGGIQALNISDGSVAASHAYQIGGVKQFLDYDGAILCWILLPGAGYKALKLNASTGAEEAQFRVGAGVAISKVVADVIYVAESPTSDFNNYDTVGYEITGDLTGYTAKVYQISATVWRGYPATLSL